jgi:hypothetical protein
MKAGIRAIRRTGWSSKLTDMAYRPWVVYKCNTKLRIPVDIRWFRWICAKTGSHSPTQVDMRRRRLIQTRLLRIMYIWPINSRYGGKLEFLDVLGPFDCLCVITECNRRDHIVSEYVWVQVVCIYMERQGKIIRRYVDSREDSSLPSHLCSWWGFIYIDLRRVRSGLYSANSRV